MARQLPTPILLGAVLKETGNPSPTTVPAKGRYMAMENATMVVTLRRSLQTESPLRLRRTR